MSSIDLRDRLNDLMWSDAYIITIEENFDQIINRLYETEIIDKIFLEEESMIDKNDFMS